MVLHGWIILLTFALFNRSYMEDGYIIYLHVDKINNKVYVGITGHSNPESRWGCGYKNDPYFNHSIKKYGFKSGKSHPDYGKPLTEEHKDSLGKAVIKTVSCRTLFGEYIKTFNSIDDASSYFKIDDGHTGQCCEGKRKTAGGYLWRFGDSTNNIPPLKKMIVLKENNDIIKEFISIQDAADYVGKHYTCVEDILKRKTETPYSGLDFKYKEVQDG